MFFIQQRLKAAVYYSTSKICEKCEGEGEATLSKQAVAAISEATWKQCQQMAGDLEMFAK